MNKICISPTREIKYSANEALYDMWVWGVAIMGAIGVIMGMKNDIFPMIISFSALLLMIIGSWYLVSDLRRDKDILYSFSRTPAVFICDIVRVVLKYAFISLIVAVASTSESIIVTVSFESAAREEFPIYVFWTFLILGFALFVLCVVVYKREARRERLDNRASKNG